MTTIFPPPPGYEIVEVEGDPDATLDPAELRLRAPDGTVVPYAEVIEGMALELEEALQHTSAMVALYPPSELASELALKGGEEPDELHMTLAFLGDADKLDRKKTEDAVRSWAAKTPELEGEIGGIGYFYGNPDSSDGTVTYASADLPELPAARQELIDALEGAGSPAASNHGFTPHMTLDYASRRPSFDLPKPVTFDRVTLAWADERISIPLGNA